MADMDKRERAFLAFLADFALAVLSITAIMGVIFLVGGSVFWHDLYGTARRMPLAGLCIVAGTVCATAVVLVIRRRL